MKLTTIDLASSSQRNRKVQQTEEKSEGKSSFKRRLARVVQWTLFVIAVNSLVWVGWAVLKSELYQRYQNSRFDVAVQELPGEKEPIDEESRPNAFNRSDSAGGEEGREESLRSVIAAALFNKEGLQPVGRLRIPRLSVSVMVSEGVDSRTLRNAVGHIPGTALPGQSGNVAIAGHRDTFFRPLEEIEKGDRIELQTLEDDHEYMVEWTRVVSPEEVSVLEATESSELTLVTCYPFSYVGSAPKRFIVRARS